MVPKTANTSPSGFVAGAGTFTCVTQTKAPCVNLAEHSGSQISTYKQCVSIQQQTHHNNTTNMNIVEALPTDLKHNVAKFLPVGPAKPFIHEFRKKMRYSRGSMLKTKCSSCQEWVRGTYICESGSPICELPVSKFCKNCLFTFLYPAHDGLMCHVCQEEWLDSF